MRVRPCLVSLNRRADSAVRGPRVHESCERQDLHKHFSHTFRCTTTPMEPATETDIACSMYDVPRSIQLTVTLRNWRLHRMLMLASPFNTSDCPTNYLRDTLPIHRHALRQASQHLPLGLRCRTPPYPRAPPCCQSRTDIDLSREPPLPPYTI